MPENPTCPSCGALVADATLRGLCPKCLARAAAVSPNRSAFLGANLPRTFGDYELLEELGRGGMGIVYRARQRSLNRTVAVKMLLDGPLANLATAGRFRSEAEAAAQLRHPNIAAIYEIGEQDGLLYFSMDYVTGVSLADLARQHPLPIATAVSLVKALAETIQFAHQRGTIHRDLKPSNIIVDEQGQPHILDFGLAKRVEAHGDFTLSGQSLGSPGYAPPEQVDGKRGSVGVWSDIYGLGAILYFVLTGRAPFAGSSLTDTFYQTLHEPPTPPRKINPAVSEALERVCLRCLEKAPAKRFTSAEAVADALEGFLEHQPTQTSLPRQNHRSSKRPPAVRRALWSLSVVLVAAGLLGVARWTSVWTTNMSTSVARPLSNDTRVAASPALTLTLETPIYGDGGKVSVNGVVTGAATVLVWSWGDGTTNRSSFPASHTYSRNGRYQIAVTAAALGGNTLIETDTLAITNADREVHGTSPPAFALTLGMPAYGDCGEVTCNGFARGAVKAFLWHWGDGSSNRSLFPATHGYASNGTYQMRVTSYALNGETIVETDTVVITNACKILSRVHDPKGNLTGDLTRTFLDVEEATVRSSPDRLVFEMRVAGNFPAEKDMAAGQRFDFIWHVDADRNLTTTQYPDWGNDYNIHICLDKTGWHPLWYNVSDLTKTNNVPDLATFSIRAYGNRASLSFPRCYLPSRSFELFLWSTTKHAPHWPPLTENRVTMRNVVEDVN